MNSKSQYLPPRQTIIFGYTRRMLDETSLNAQSFAMAVAENYLLMTAPDVRHVPFALGDDLGHAMKGNAQTLRRYMDGTVKVLPADLEDAWVASAILPAGVDCYQCVCLQKIPMGRWPVCHCLQKSSAN